MIVGGLGGKSRDRARGRVSSGDWGKCPDRGGKTDVTRVRESEKGRERVRRKAVFVFVGRDRGGS